MRGVSFDDRVAPVARSPYRADVALFVGYVDRRRRMHLPDGAPGDERLVETVIEDRPQLYRWLVAEDWATGNPVTDRARLHIDELLNIPVPIDRYETFEQLFAGDARPWGPPELRQTCETYLAAAVRSFFAQGGRLCYVVRVGVPGPVPVAPNEADAAILGRPERLAALMPADPSPLERETWQGAWTLFGLPDVSFVCLPDLPDLVRGPLQLDGEPPPLPATPVAFEECSQPSAAVERDQRVRELVGPTSDDAGYTAWAGALQRLVDEVAQPRTAGSLREVQIVAAVPRPSDDRVGDDLLDYLREVGVPTSAFLQLVYPWLSTNSNGDLPEGLEPPDGAACGLLARNALERGTYRSAAGQALDGLTEVLPKLSGRDLSDPGDLTTLGAHVTLVGNTPAGFALLSDVTTSADATFRLAHANRCTSALVRALRVIGENHAFDASNERLWQILAERSRDVLVEFWQAGALRGTTRNEAFTVTCDRTTMTQDDLDNGRVIVDVEAALTMSIQRIHVVLTRTRDGLSLERAA